MNSLETVRKVKERHSTELLNKANVVGLTVGYKKRGGERTEKPSLVVMVRRKLAISELEKEDIVPPEIETVVTDVEEVGDIKAIIRTLERSGYRLRIL